MALLTMRHSAYGIHEFIQRVAPNSFDAMHTSCVDRSRLKSVFLIKILFVVVVVIDFTSSPEPTDLVQQNFT